MKLTLLILFVCSFFFVSHAQQVMAADSLYSTYSGFGISQRLDSVRTYEYDSLCRKSAYQAYYADRDSLDNITLRGYQQEKYFYYPNDSLRQVLYQSKYIYDTLYTNNGRLTYTYTDKGQIATQVYEVQFDSTSSAWTTTSVITTTYDAAGNITDNIVQEFDYSEFRLANKTWSRYEYNSRGQNTVATFLIWGYNQQAWVPQFRTLSDYDDSGYLVKTTEQYQDQNAEVPVWESQNETGYYNNFRGQVDSSVYTSFTDIGEVDKTYFVYNPATSLLSQTSIYYYFNDHLDYATRTRYIHALSDSIQADTTFREFLPMGEDSFVVYDEYALTSFYNEDGTVRHRTESFGWLNGNYAYSFDDQYGYTSCSSVLPVSLLSFTAVRNGADAVVKWQTNTGLSTSYFTVARSTDGIHFSPLGKVYPSGNDSYTYVDKNMASLSAVRLYYQLATTDKKGTVSYSRIAQLDMATGNFIVQVSPNPARDLLTLRSATTISNAWIAVHDVNGRLLYTAKQSIAAGSALPIDISGFVKGVYVLTVQSANGKYTFKIVKQ